MTAELHANPNPAPSGGSTEICITGAAPSSTIQIKCVDARGSETFDIETDGAGKGCHTFAIPSGWTAFTVEGGGAQVISVLVT